MSLLLQLIANDANSSDPLEHFNTQFSIKTRAVANRLALNRAKVKDPATESCLCNVKLCATSGSEGLGFLGPSFVNSLLMFLDGEWLVDRRWLSQLARNMHGTL